MKKIRYIIEEQDQFYQGGYEEFGDYDSLEEARQTIIRLTKDWPASSWRIVKITEEVVK